MKNVNTFATSARCEGHPSSVGLVVFSRFFGWWGAKQEGWHALLPLPAWVPLQSRAPKRSWDHLQDFLQDVVFFLTSETSTTDSRPALQLENTLSAHSKKLASLLITTQTPNREDPWPVTTLFKIGMGLFGDTCAHTSQMKWIWRSAVPRPRAQVWEDSLHIIMKPDMSRKSLDVMDANCKSQVKWLWNPIKQREAEKCFILLF